MGGKIHYPDKLINGGSNGKGLHRQMLVTNI